MIYYDWWFDHILYKSYYYFRKSKQRKVYIYIYIWQIKERWVAPIKCESEKMKLWIILS